MLLITTEAAAYGKNRCEIHIKADPAPHKSSKPYKRKQTSMFVPYSRITASVSLYTTSRSPFLPVCLTSRRPLTIFFSLLPVFLSPFSLLSPIPRSYLSHISLIPPAFLPHSSPPPTTLPKPEVTKSDKKKKQATAASNPSRQENQEPDKSNTRKQTGTNNGQEAQGRYRARQDNIRYHKGQAKTGRQKVAAVRKTAERQQNLSQLPAPTTHPRRAVCTLSLPPLRGSRITGYHVNFKNRLR